MSERLTSPYDNPDEMTRDFAEWFESAYQKLKRYEEAEENGRLLTLPCNPEDVVYTLHKKYDPDGDKEIYILTEEIVLNFVITGHYTVAQCSGSTYDLSEFGCNVFTDRSDAEYRVMHLNKNK